MQVYTEIGDSLQLRISVCANFLYFTESEGNRVGVRRSWLNDVGFQRKPSNRTEPVWRRFKLVRVVVLSIKELLRLWEMQQGDSAEVLNSLLWG